MSGPGVEQPILAVVGALVVPREPPGAAGADGAAAGAAPPREGAPSRDGRGADAAVAAARVGAHVRFVGAVADDAAGRAALAALVAEGVVVDDVVIGAADAHLDADHVRAALRALPDLHVVLVSSEVPVAAVVAAVGTAAGRGVRCVLDPAPVVPAVLGLLELGVLLTPNADELREVVRLGARPGTVTSSTAAAAATVHSWSGSPVVVTLGGDGVLLVEDGRVRRLGAHPTTVRDPAGAGATLDGVLAAGLAAGADVEDALHDATVAAALAVAAEGARAGMPTAATLGAALDDDLDDDLSPDDIPSPDPSPDPGPREAP